MANGSAKRSSFGKKFFKVVMTVVIMIALFGVGLVSGFASKTDNFTVGMLLEHDFWEDFYGMFADYFETVFGKNDSEKDIETDVESTEMISFEGVKLSEVANLEMLKYIDFTIPYNWAFGKIDVENPSTEEAIAITTDNVVLTISLRNIEMAGDKESILWAEEALVFELKNEYPDHLFTKPAMFEDEVAIVQGTSDVNNAKLYIAIIPVEDKTIYVNYSFMSEDWLADLYFNTVIHEMLTAH